MDDVTWGALAAGLTVVGAIYTWQAFKRRGGAAGTRGLALTLLPAAAWLTGTLELFTEIGSSIGDWAKSLIFDPFVWVGVVLAGLAVLLWVIGGFLHGRNAKKAAAARTNGSAATTLSAPAARTSGSTLTTTPARSTTPADDDLDDVEAILKRRGIE